MPAIFAKHNFSQSDVENFKAWKSQMRDAWAARKEANSATTASETQPAAAPATSSQTISPAADSAAQVVAGAAEVVSAATSQTLTTAADTASKSETALDLTAPQVEKVAEAIKSAVTAAVSGLLGVEPEETAAPAAPADPEEAHPETGDHARRAALATIARAQQQSLLDDLSSSPFNPVAASTGQANGSYGIGREAGSDDTRQTVTV